MGLAWGEGCGLGGLGWIGLLRTDAAVGRGELEFFEDHLVGVVLEALGAVGCFGEDEVRLVGVALCTS